MTLENSLKSLQILFGWDSHCITQIDKVINFILFIENLNVIESSAVDGEFPLEYIINNCDLHINFLFEFVVEFTEQSQSVLAVFWADPIYIGSNMISCILTRCFPSRYIWITIEFQARLKVIESVAES